ncbi:MAG: Phosphoglycerol transferase [Pseudomonadota bacterium]
MLQTILPIPTGLLLVLVSLFASAATNPDDSARYPASLSEGIDFSRPGYPEFIADVKGLSAYEKTHRWTDAQAGPSARFRFKEPLPDRFVLEIEAEAFGPNGTKPTTIRLGKSTATVAILVRNAKPHYIELTNPDGSDTLEITPPQPISPLAFDGSSGDTRKLGIAFKRLAIRSPFEIALMRFSKDSKAFLNFWVRQLQDSMKKLPADQIKVRAFEYAHRFLRWTGLD